MKNDGTKLESKVQDALKAYCANHLALWYRFPDSKAARNLIVNQPGDFMMTLPGAAILIECKSTWDGATFWSLLDATQLAKHRLWMRAGHPTTFFYANLRKGEVVLYRGDAVVDVAVHGATREDLLLGSAAITRMAPLIERIATEYGGNL